MKQYFNKLPIGVVLVLCFTSSVFTDGHPDYHEFDIIWSGLGWMDAHTSLLLASNGSVYRTEDTGATWSPLNGAMAYWGTTNAIYLNYRFPNVIYATSSVSSRAWSSQDKGKTWKLLNPGMALAYFDFHPTNPTWLLGYDGSAVWVSNNLGDSWTLLLNTAYTYTWGDAGVGEVPASRVYLTTVDGNYQSFLYTDDWGNNLIEIKEKGFDFVFGNQQVFAIVELTESNSVALEVSNDYGKSHKEFRTALFPNQNELDFQRFVVLDDSTGAAYMGIQHTDRSPYGTLYVSDLTGARYDISLQYVSFKAGSFDFFKVRGMEGVHIANVLVDYKQRFSPVRTKITRDNGGSWEDLPAPHFDSNGEIIKCNTSRCTLNLYGYYAGAGTGAVYRHPLTSENAVGLILANGNVGDELEEYELNTYMSRDGGLSWIELKKGPSNFAFQDHGAIMIFIEEESTRILYSLDMKTLVPMNVSNEPFHVIRIEAGGTPTGTQFTLLVDKEGSDEPRGVINLDFAQVWSRTCELYEYENWSPNGDVNVLNQTACMLGHRTVYQRKIANADCFNNDTIEEIVDSYNCPCTLDDWECDYGFERSSNDPSICEPSDPNSYDPDTIPHNCPPGTTYNVSRGYQLEPGNTCMNPQSQYLPIQKICPETAATTAHKRGWIAAAVLVPLIVVIIIAALVAIRSETVREALPFLKILPHWTAGYSGFARGNTSLVDEEDVAPRGHESEEEEDKEFSIQADELEDQQIEDLNSHDTARVASPKQRPHQQVNLISMDDVMGNDDDFNPRK